MNDKFFDKLKEMFNSVPLDEDEEAWFFRRIADFDYIVKSGRYGPMFYPLLSDETKQILYNLMWMDANKEKIDVTRIKTNTGDGAGVRDSTG